MLGLYGQKKGKEVSFQYFISSKSRKSSISQMSSHFSQQLIHCILRYGNIVNVTNFPFFCFSNVCTLAVHKMSIINVGSKEKTH
jgi:hypothetical protein